jgi:hypothetical protein
MIANIAWYNRGNTQQFPGGTWKNRQMMALDFQYTCPVKVGRVISASMAVLRVSLVWLPRNHLMRYAKLRTSSDLGHVLIRNQMSTLSSTGIWSSSTFGPRSPLASQHAKTRSFRRCCCSRQWQEYRYWRALEEEPPLSVDVRSHLYINLHKEFEVTDLLDWRVARLLLWRVYMCDRHRPSSGCFQLQLVAGPGWPGHFGVAAVCVLTERPSWISAFSQYSTERRWDHFVSRKMRQGLLLLAQLPLSLLCSSYLGLFPSAAAAIVCSCVCLHSYI